MESVSLCSTPSPAEVSHCDERWGHWSLLTLLAEATGGLLGVILLWEAQSQKVSVEAGTGVVSRLQKMHPKFPSTVRVNKRE